MTVAPFPVNKTTDDITNILAKSNDKDWLFLALETLPC